MNERFAITLETVPGHDTPGAVRLRGLLKTALRAFGLKCVTAKELTATDAQASAPPNDCEGK